MYEDTGVEIGAASSTGTARQYMAPGKEGDVATKVGSAQASGNSRQFIGDMKTMDEFRAFWNS